MLATGCVALFSLTFSLAQQTKTPDDGVFKIQANVDRVLVPVVVRDKHGLPVGDLKSEDFQVFDNDKLHPLSGFSIEERPGATNGGANSTTFKTPAGASTSSAPNSRRIIVFLFDDLHLDATDLANAKKASANLLSGTLLDSDVAAVVSISGKTNSGVTNNRTKLLDAIKSLQPQTVYRTAEADCPNVNYYQADLIENKNDENALQDAMQQIRVCSPTKPDLVEGQARQAARRVLLAGEQDVQVTLASITEFVRRMGAFPWQRTMILVSPGFLTLAPEAFSAESHLIDLAAQYNVTISTLDARGLYTTAVAASADTRRGYAQEITALRSTSLTQTANPLAALADGTGGTFFQNSNDLNAGFKLLTEAPESVYLLELSLANERHNGAYHRLKVKVIRDGLQVHARHGYFMPKAEKKKK